MSPQLTTTEETTEMKPCKLPSVRSSLLFPSTIDELFNRFWNDSPKYEFAPNVDVKETPESYVIRAELPGVDADDVEVSVTSDSLTIKGEKKVETKTEDERGHITERVYGTFSRSFTFPVPVAPEEVTAEAKKGVLHITVKKSETEQTRKIEIKSD